MTFCNKEKQLIDSGTTAVDNSFLLNYLPDAADIRSAVYLLGLALSDSNGTDNSCETIANKLNISCDDVMSAFLYWEELGLVAISNDTPPTVTYLSTRGGANSLKKIKPSKYAKFSKDIQAVIEGRLITVNEYNEYYNFLESTTFEPAALVAVAKYCVELKGSNIGYQYVLTVARNQLHRGATTLAAVTDRLNNQQKYDGDLKLVFKAMGSSRSFEHADREAYEKWTKEFGFTLDTVVAVAKNCKTGGVTRLDSKLTEYYKRGAMSVKEIEAYEQQKTRLYDLARAINKTIGVYYQSLDAIVDEYITAWLRRGYDDETLLAIAKYCFKSGIRNLTGLASVIDKLYKNGVTNLDTLENYLDTLAENDGRIQRVLVKCGLDRRTTPSDRQLYKTWTESWGMPQDVIEFVAEKAAGTNAPMAYVNRVLSDYKQHGVFDLTAAENYKSESVVKAAAATTANVGGKDMKRREYSDDEINALFSTLDEEDD